MAINGLLSALSAATNAVGNSATVPSPSMTTDASQVTAQPISPTPQGQSVVNKATKAANPPVPKQSAATPSTQGFQGPVQPQPSVSSPMPSTLGTGPGPIHALTALATLLNHPEFTSAMANTGAPIVMPPAAQSYSDPRAAIMGGMTQPAESQPTTSGYTQQFMAGPQSQDQSQANDADLSAVRSSTDKLNQAITDAAKQNMPTPPTFQQLGPWDDQQKFMDLLKQANTMRLQAANQPVPRQQQMSPLLALLAGALATGDRSGNFANNFLQNFNQSAQSANQGALQQYQENQTAAGIGAQLPEQEAQNLLQQRTQAFQQMVDMNKNAVEQYKAELGYNGKVNPAVIRGLVSTNNAQVQAQARQTAADILANSHVLAAGTTSAWKVFGDPVASQGQKQAALQEIMSNNPTVFGGMSPEAVDAILSSASPKQVELLAKADTDKARAAFLYGKTANLPLEAQQVIAQIGQIQSKTNLSDAQMGLIMKQIQNYDTKFQGDAAKVAAETELIRQKIANGGASDPTDQIKILSAANNSLKQEADIAQRQINEIKKSYGGNAPPDGSPDTNRYIGFKAIVDAAPKQIATNVAAMNGLFVKPVATQTPTLGGAVGSGIAHNVQSGQPQQSQADQAAKATTPWNTMYVRPGLPSVRGDVYYLSLIKQGYPPDRAQAILRDMYNRVNSK